jgi:hypothetical protein
MSVFKAIYGQSIWDVILNTYTTFDNAIKMLIDNNLSNINIVPSSQQPFKWDDTIVADQSISVSNSSVIYATLPIPNGNIMSVVSGTSGPTGNNNNFVEPSNPNYNNMIKYEQNTEVQYTASGGETSVIITDLIGSRIVQITREIRPMLFADFNFNSNNGQITFNNGISLNSGETLFIIKASILTS